MSYVDALFDRNADILRVVERKEGKRHFTEYPIKYTFFYKDPRGKYKSIYGDPLNRIVSKSTKDFRKELAINNTKQLFESDINPIFQCLSENYLNVDAPKLNVAFFDIETDFDPERGFADPSEPFMPITAISVHLQWMNTLVTLAVPPKTLTMEEAKEKAGEHMVNYMKWVCHWRGLGNHMDPGEELPVTKGKLDLLSYDFLHKRNMLFGTPEYVIDKIHELKSELNLQNLQVWSNFPGVKHEDCMKSIKMFTDKVMPHFKDDLNTEVKKVS